MARPTGAAAAARGRARPLVAGLFLVLLLTTGIAVAGTPPYAHADGPITVTGAPGVENKFPSEVLFSVDGASTAAEITDVTLHYQLLPDGNRTSGRAEFDTSKSVHAVYHMRTAGNPLYLPPTKTIRYYWTIQDGEGNQVQTDPVDWTYQDTRFTFKTASNGNLTLYYLSGSDANAQRILSVGRQALDKAAALDGVTIDFPVHLVTYGTQAQILPALSHESASVDPNILGQANAPDIVVLVAGDLSGSDNEDTVRHELTHLVNARAVDEKANALPLWLDEGLAVYGQNDPGGFASAVKDAIRNDAVVSIRNLTPGVRGTDAGLFYGEGWSIVKFLVDAYGAPKLADLMAAFKAGSSEDAAFTRVYGADRDGVYNAWRKSVGLKEVAPAPAQQPTAGRPSSVSTPRPAPTRADNTGAAAGVAPTTVAQPAPKPAASTGSDSGSNLALIIAAIGGGAAILALIVGAVVGGLALSRRGR